MTAVPASLPGFRAGRLFCICPAPADAAGQGVANLALHAAGFAAGVLAQVLTFALLPLAGTLYAPTSTLGTLPYAAVFVGAAVATFPASFLLDAFGRRAAFSLGASLGIAGGLILAWGLLRGFFPALVIGAFWLGIANGFSLFHRHAAASADPRAVGIVLGAGAVAGVLAPTLAAAVEGVAAGATFAGMAAAAAAAHVLSLALAFALPPPAVMPEARAPGPARSLALPTAVAAFAWFAMTAVMGAQAVTLFACGLSTSAVAGGVSWHVVAMYAPALLVARAGLSARVGLVAGAALLVGGGVALLYGGVGGAIVSLALVGAAWSITTAAASVLLHADGGPPRWALAAHDLALLVAAVGGALASVALSRIP